MEPGGAWAWPSAGQAPLVMGVLNVTPDSFSDGGNHLSASSAVTAGLRMVAAGAQILDIGGESTRPGSMPVTPSEEQDRILPVVESLLGAGLPISVDTRNAATMAAALDAGAAIVNDISALRHDPASAALVARRRCPVILMHMRGAPATMASLAHYDDVAADVAAELAAIVAQAEAAGVARCQIALDPGIGFAKTGEQNVSLLQGLGRIAALGFPLVVGVSRKRFIGTLGGEPDAQARDPGSVAAALFALSRGVRVVRVHNVAATPQAIRVWHALAG